MQGEADAAGSPWGMSSPVPRSDLSRRLLSLTLLVLCASPPSASAHALASHQVAPGETLTGIAAANGMSVARLAAANGLPWDANVIAGQAIEVPPRDGLYTASSGQTLGYATSSTPPPAASAAAAAPATSTPAASAGGGGSAASVRPGDTLSGIAARLGVSRSALAAANGLSSPDLVFAGTTLRVPGASAAPAATSAPPAASTTSVGSGPEGARAATGTGAAPTAERLSSSEIAAIAAEQGVPGNLAAAIAWQESGNNNAMVSSAGARGVMQIMPGTWDWINGTLAGGGLTRASARDNVRAGSLFLRQLLRETGGDESAAIAGYYQGLGSVRSRGLYDDTQQYVGNVQALRGRVGN